MATETTSSTQGGSLAQANAEIAELRRTVFDLLVEVEAIRATLLKSELGVGEERSPYAIAYRDTALETHNSAGSTGGFNKLLERFYPDPRQQCSWIDNLYEQQADNWRECLFMRRVGMSPDDIAKYQSEAESAHAYT